MAFNQPFGSVVAGGNFHQTGATQYHEIGSVMEVDSGMGVLRFRYVKAGASPLVAGNALVGPAPTTANHKNVNCLAASIGDKTVTVVLGATAAAENLYAGGLLWVNAGTGRGRTYRVSGHPSHAGSGNLAVSLHDPVAVALVASGTSKVTLVRSPYNGVVQAGATPASKLLGVAVSAIAANEFGWIQTKGPCSVLEGGTDTVAGDLVTAAASGACALATNVIADLHILGVCHEAQAASGEETLVWLGLE